MLFSAATLKVAPTSHPTTSSDPAPTQTPDRLGLPGGRLGASRPSMDPIVSRGERAASAMAAIDFVLSVERSSVAVGGCGVPNLCYHTRRCRRLESAGGWVEGMTVAGSGPCDDMRMCVPLTRVRPTKRKHGENKRTSFFTM